jgi:hypothetical protein
MCTIEKQVRPFSADTNLEGGHKNQVADKLDTADPNNYRKVYLNDDSMNTE